MKNLRLLYFASYREQLGLTHEDIKGEFDTVNDLIELLQARSGVWRDIFDNNPNLMVAINQHLEKASASLRDGDVVAFFPPVTGG